MDIERIKELIKLVEATDIAGLAVEDGDLKIEIKKQPDGAVYAAPSVAVAPTAKLAAEATQPTPPADAHHGLTAIKAPMTGTFYAAGSPDMPPYVSVGDRIKSGQPVCIVEAMKTFNEIESDISGTVEKILVRNQEPVEFGQALILVKEG
jgi:acetyl-CoA carboxylase biotin carboxyl carrier protein